MEIGNVIVYLMITGVFFTLGNNLDCFGNALATGHESVSGLEAD